jgi:ankyrin repeat protein
MGLHIFKPSSEKLVDAAQHRDALVNVRKLLERGADVNGQTEEYGTSALMRASRQGDYRVALMLVKDFKADLNLRDKEGMTALLWAARFNQTEVMNILLGGGADAKCKTNTGENALMLAGEYGKTELLERLIGAGLDVNAQDSKGNTALMNAAECGNTEMVRVLMDNGADVNIKNKEQKTALDFVSGWDSQTWYALQGIEPPEPEPEEDYSEDDAEEDFSDEPETAETFPAPENDDPSPGVTDHDEVVEKQRRMKARAPRLNIAPR